MQVVCIANSIGAILEPGVRERIRRCIHIEGPITDLTLGKEYPVQALEHRDGGVWFYIHTVPENVYPFPYPAEMFDLRQNALPSDWIISFSKRDGTFDWKRITFPAWANNDHFYEQLVEDDPEALSIYQASRVNAEALLNSSTIVCSEIANDFAPILYAERSEPEDQADSGWQFLCGAESENQREAKVWALREVLEREPSLRQFIEHPVGTILSRASPHVPWQVARLS